MVQIPEEEEPEDTYRLRDPRKDEVDEDAKADFDRDFARMLADTTDARRGERKKNAAPIFDTAVPHIKRKPGDFVESGEEGKLAFTLLSKKGNRQQVSSADQSRRTKVTSLE